MRERRRRRRKVKWQCACACANDTSPVKRIKRSRGRRIKKNSHGDVTRVTLNLSRQRRRPEQLVSHWCLAIAIVLMSRKWWVRRANTRTLSPKKSTKQTSTTATMALSMRNCKWRANASGIPQSGRFLCHCFSVSLSRDAINYTWKRGKKTRQQDDSFLSLNVDVFVCSLFTFATRKRGRESTNNLTRLCRESNE